MLKILSTGQIREADRATIEREPIESIDLMERAAAACVKWLCGRYDSTKPVIVLAGAGNNGGDALAMSRKLLEAGYDISTFVVRYSEKFSADMQINLDRLKSLGHDVRSIQSADQLPAITGDSIVIDGLFGSGLNRPIEGLASQCIQRINESRAEVVSIDMPSGLYADDIPAEGATIIFATHTLVFQFPRLGFLIPGSEMFTGEWYVVDIALDPSYISAVPCTHYFIDDIREYASFLRRSKFDHKGKFGHVVIAAGAYGKMGAAVLATKAALRIGAGKVTAHIPRLGYDIMQCSVPEAMCSVDGNDELLCEIPSLSGIDAVGFGPGVGKARETQRFLQHMIESSKVPLLLDADALNLLGESSEMIASLPANTILTPHLAEFERMFGRSGNAIERLRLLRKMAVEHNIIIILKGAYSSVAAPDGNIYFNSTGNPGMATAGSGDVLTGVITGLLAQIREPLVAAICGVYLHGLAGDIAAKNYGMHGMIASDIIACLGLAIDRSINLKI